MIEVSRVSSLTGMVHYMNLPVTVEQLNAHANGALAQDVFSHLTPEEREFLISGCTPEEWEQAFGKEDN